MSGKFSSALMFISLSAIAIAANHAQDAVSTNGRKITRAPAMITKEQILGPGLSAPLLHHTEKLHGPLNVSLEMVGARPEQIGDVFILRGTITSRRPLAGTGYQWSIPRTIELVNGSVSGTFDAVSPDQSGVVEITLKKISNDNVQVHLLAEGGQGSARFAESAQYNTELQPVLDAKKEDFKKASLSDGPASAGGELKVFH